MSEKQRSNKDPETKLWEKIFKARKEAQPVAKEGRNEDQDFDFSRFEDVFSEAKRLLEKHRILYIPRLVEETVQPGHQGGCLARAVIEYEVIDLTSGATLTMRWAGTGFDSPGDKALFKAQTGCDKYFLKELLGIPFGTDPEADSVPVPRSWIEPDVDHDRGKRIQEAMDAADWSAADLAKKIGVDRSHIYGWRAGRPIPSDHLGALAEELGVLRLWITTGEGPKARHEKPLPVSDLPEPDYQGLTEVAADA